MSHVSSPSKSYYKKIWETGNRPEYYDKDPRHGTNHNQSAGNRVTELGAGSLKIEESFLTTSEAAEFLRISKASLLNLSSNGKVPYYKFQRRNRYLKSDLLKLLLSNKKGAFNGS